MNEQHRPQIFNYSVIEFKDLRDRNGRIPGYLLQYERIGPELWKTLIHTTRNGKISRTTQKAPFGSAANAKAYLEMRSFALNKKAYQNKSFRRVDNV